MPWGIAVCFAFPHEDSLVKKLGSHWSRFLLRELNVQSSLKFVHTSFHGVGHDYVQLAFKAFGFQPPIPVPEQKDPDPDFSTVKCPNPEEGECVLVFWFLLPQVSVGRERAGRACFLLCSCGQSMGFVSTGS